jgi:hypothetical protein
MTEWNERSNRGPSQRVAEAGGSPALEARGAGGSGPDNAETGRYRQTVRARQARREGVAIANQCLTSLDRGSGSNLVDGGRGAAHADAQDRGGDSEGGLSWPARRPRGRTAAYSWRGCRDKAGHRLRRSVAGERGNRPGAARLGGQARCRLWAPGRGGALVVVRAGESPAHGEGGQRACGARLEGEEDRR